MAIIRPFRGIRYNQAKVRNLDAVVTPPYDVISPADQDFYYERHPNNIIRIILPREENKYENAAMNLRNWLDGDVLCRDAEPSFYACAQEYEIRGERKRRTGFTCLVRLEDYERRTVLPHENILARPREDRLNMLRATNANFDSVFGLYAGSKVNDILKPLISNPPDSSAYDKDGVKCDLWKVSEPAMVDGIIRALANESILIADGHHRYAAALAYRDEMREKHDDSDPDAPWEFVMMTLVSLEDEGLVILPTHRLVYNLEGFDAGDFIGRLSEYFDVKPVTADKLVETIESMDSKGNVFGLYAGDGKSYAIKLKPSVKPEAVIDSPGSDALKRLDVSVLHSLILERLLGIGAQQLSTQSNLSYIRDPNEALSAVDRGDCQMAFLMNPTKVEEVKAIAASGEKMPQKSTFFYPKLLTGMILRLIEN